MNTRQILGLIVMAGATVVHADDYVNTADANGDGFVSLHELRAAYFADPEFNRRIEQSFDQYDRNGDGLISADERRAVEVRSNQDLQIAPKPELADEVLPATASPAPEPEARQPHTGSRFAAWMRELDTDNSGGASAAELLANGGGQRWFTDREFDAADRNESGELDAVELELLVQSLERRQR